MIELKIEKYCEDCPNFEPEVTVDYYYDGKPIKYIACTKAEDCQRMFQYIATRFMKDQTR